MAQRGGQGIGHVGRLGRGRQGQLALDRTLHLRLRRPAAAGQNPLDLRGRVVLDRESRPGRRPGRSRRGHGPSGSPFAAARSASKAPRSPSRRASGRRSPRPCPRGFRRGVWRATRATCRGSRPPRIAASGPVGFQNAVAGDVQAGIDAEDAQAVVMRWLGCFCKTAIGYKDSTRPFQSLIFHPSSLIILFPLPILKSFKLLTRLVVIA